ncbi:MAG: MBL fold metallo-hydrolase [Anaerolineaceae bacterium]|nr:MBL fold metallo-hydrolase [Anaerolineaceae bacterium]
MPLSIHTLILGPMENNTFILGDADARDAVVIDPSFNDGLIQKETKKFDLEIKAIWLTHAHFDHYAGASSLSKSYNPPLPISLHIDDLSLWRRGGGAREFGIDVDQEIEPKIYLKHKEILYVGKQEVEVRHTPGHSPGHIVFYVKDIGTVFCGDLIFRRGIGRTDLPGGDYQTLITSIKTQIFSLPSETRLLCGHGPETTVAQETTLNPFL